MIAKLRGQYSSQIVFEITMKGLLQKQERPPVIDLWYNHIELDHRQFKDLKYGQ